MDKKYPDFWSVIIGNDPIGFLLGYIAIAYVCAVGMILFKALGKYKKVEGSPDEWSGKYFVTNNLGNFVAGLFFVPVFVRLAMEWIDNSGFLLATTIGIGLGFYYLAKIANNFGIWTTDKLSEKLAEKIKSTETKN